MPEKYKKPIKYILAGGCATLVNLAALYALVEYAHLWYLLGAMVAFSAGVVTSYTLQKFWTFRDKDTSNIRSQFTLFFTYALAALVLNTLFMYIMVDLVEIWYLLSQVISSLLIAFINYHVFNTFIFKNQNDQVANNIPIEHEASV